MNLVASGCLWPSLATKAQGFAAHRAADSRERFCLLKSVLASPRFLLKDFQNLCHTIAALTNFGWSLAGAACDGQPNVGEATGSEARFAPKGPVANEVSAAIPPDARSASGGTFG